MPRTTFDALRLDLADGDKVHVYGRPELYEARGVFQLRALSLEPLGLGAALARIERLKRTLAAEGLFARRAEAAAPAPPAPDRAPDRQRGRREARLRHRGGGALPGRARRSSRRRYVQGPKAPRRDRRRRSRRSPRARGRRRRRRPRRRQLRGPPPLQRRAGRARVAACPVPVVSAVGHEQDTPLCDLAADARASTPTAAARLVVPDERELRAGLDRLRARARARHAADPRARAGRRWPPTRERLARAPALLLERKRRALDALAGRLRRCPRGRRSSAATPSSGRTTASSAPRSALRPGAHIDVELAEGGLGARVEETRP